MDKLAEYLNDQTWLFEIIKGWFVANLHDLILALVVGLLTYGITRGMLMSQGAKDRLFADIITEGVENAVFSKRISRRQAVWFYRTVGAIFQNPDFVPRPKVKQLKMDINARLGTHTPVALPVEEKIETSKVIKFAKRRNVV